MTPRLSRITAREARAALGRAGFVESRQSGSHLILKNEHGCRVTLPMHGPTVLKLALLRAILRDAGLTTEQFVALLR